MQQDAIIISRAGGPEVLVPARCDIPQPAADEVVVKVAWAGVNRHDCGQRSRGPNEHESDIPGLEVSGTVHAVGPLARGLEVGMQVCALVNGGGYAEYVATHWQQVLPVPAGLTLQQAACLPEAAFTTWYNFFSLAALQVGESVLIHGATSGVGVFAVQLLSALGHPVYATSGSAEKCALALSLGARRAFNYKTEPFAQLLQEAGTPVDVILDMSGGRHMEQNLAALAYGGRILHLSSGAAPVSLSLRAVMQKEARVTGAMMRPLPAAKKALVAQALKKVVWPLVGSRIQTRVHQTYPLAQASQAHRDMEQGDHSGKLLLQVGAA
ncbi:NAD(P)H-quinone oxidoreductase [Pigmentiphaga kullae]|uniref:Putative PIG3 family NAD(P)H quinone oxidoreductase n=1 Tax=Pigmentiphaga kullae TaxID=151784 RepID=A0A4Q7NKE7_9BURK|nr:NAD(P)H-quinone oxidoreductase [Pigmentiphaga kullae]RZS85483.1 putative PIG3 family NAD(P)H quinone oxidoreductase [Pigmentiphaga kullae]